MVLMDLDYGPRPVPLGRVASRLILDQYLISALEGGEAIGVLVPSCSSLCEAFRHCLFTSDSLVY